MHKFIRSRAALFGHVVLLALLAAVSVSGSGLSIAQDPWSHWQRTATRLGNTDTIGPRTATLAWSSPYTTEPNPTTVSLALVIDRHGHLIAGSPQGVAVLDPDSHDMIWEQIVGDTAGKPAVHRDRVLIVRDDPSGAVFCFDASTGEELWSAATGGQAFAAPVIGGNTVFITDNTVRKVLAYDIEDGELLWSFATADSFFNRPSLDWPSLLTCAGRPMHRVSSESCHSLTRPHGSSQPVEKFREPRRSWVTAFTSLQQIAGSTRLTQKPVMNAGGTGRSKSTWGRFASATTELCTRAPAGALDCSLPCLPKGHSFGATKCRPSSGTHRLSMARIESMSQLATPGAFTRCCRMEPNCGQWTCPTIAVPPPRSAPTAHFTFCARITIYTLSAIRTPPRV